MDAPAFSADLGSLSLIEVSDARELAGTIFRDTFHAEVPDFPRHFVLLKRTPREAPATLGYVHYTRTESVYLAGGLVVAAMEFRRLDKETQQLVREQGGLAEWVMRTSCDHLSDSDAIFAYMGDAKSIQVNARVGFRFTGSKYLYVIWKNCVDPEVRNAIVERIAALGPF